jgi:hypothetical protein
MTHPEYETDRADERANNVNLKMLSFPGIECSACGQIWGGSRFMNWPVPKRNIRSFQNEWPIRSEDWFRLRDDYLDEVNLPKETLILPGDRIGIGSAKISSPKISDVIFPLIGVFLFGERAASVLQNSGFRGAELLKIPVSFSSKKCIDIEPPVLYQLRVTGKARNVGSPDSDTVVCDVCHRSISKHTTRVREVDESRWDGSDIFNMDENENMVFVTERVREALLTAQLNNVVFKELPLPVLPIVLEILDEQKARLQP